jgi:hypothetical protein
MHLVFVLGESVKPLSTLLTVLVLLGAGWGLARLGYDVIRTMVLYQRDRELIARLDRHATELAELADEQPQTEGFR